MGHEGPVASGPSDKAIEAAVFAYKSDRHPLRVAVEAAYPIIRADVESELAKNWIEYIDTIVVPEHRAKVIAEVVEAIREKSPFEIRDHMANFIERQFQNHVDRVDSPS